MMFHKGITGFGKGSSGMVNAAVSMTGVSSHMYAAANATGYRVQAIFPPGPATNYFRVLFRNHPHWPDFDLVINGVHPFYATISPASSWGNLQFVECPEAIRQVLWNTFNYQSPAYLQTNFAEEDLTHLDPVEIQQIRYHQCKTRGEVVFNHFD